MKTVAAQSNGSKSAAGKASSEKVFTNSIDMKLIRIEAGTFRMGCLNPTPPDSLEGPELLQSGDYDEHPIHDVNISQPFHMSETEVTIEQFRKFRRDYPGYEDNSPYASAVSWYDAVAFCEWLSKKEGRPYRLPTEAEWEYACRAGTQTLFSSGSTPPEHETANPWGLKNMHTGVLEWCLDWHAPYPNEPQTDPVGPERGWMKLVRGGGLDTMSSYYGGDFAEEYTPWMAGKNPYYLRSANRASIAPSFGPPPAEYQAKQLEEGQTDPPPSRPPYRAPFRAGGLVPGLHSIGFRVVLAPQPQTKPWSFEPPFFQRCVKQTRPMTEPGPDPNNPWYKTRRIFPEIDWQQMIGIGWKIGLPPGLGINHHNPALAALPNGDLLVFYHNGFVERNPDLSLVALRLRCGSEQWDIPSVWPDFLDGNDQASIIWNDNGKLWLIWGCPRLGGGYPFQWITSTDNGATWSEVQFPLFESRIGHYSPQPINSVFRGPDRSIYLGIDGGTRGTSALFVSRNNGRTWFDPKGRTRGRHATFVLLDGGKILGYGGKLAHVKGFMPKNISKDWGRTWEVSKAPLPSLGNGQRPSLIKLASGRLCYASDFQNSRPDLRYGPYKESGAFVGLSDDNGETWRIKKLIGGNTRDLDGKPVDVRTVGYVTMCQSDNGLVHLVTSRNGTDLHIEFNEAWVLQDDEAAKTAVAKDQAKMVPDTLKKHSENYPDGKPKVTWTAGVGEDGRYLLHGKETWYHENGKKQWEATYDGGCKVGTETYWCKDGSERWQWEYGEDRNNVWVVRKPSGKPKAVSCWRDGRLISHKLSTE
jgi:formylglycine-generating enzyme required for sulfatase activity